MRNFTSRSRRPADMFRILCAIVLTILILIAIMLDSGHAENTLTATLDRTSMSVDETAELTITVDGASVPAPDIPEVEGLSITRTGQSRQIRMVNGSTTSSLSLSYLIEAQRPGTFVIPAIEISIDGKKLSTEAIPLEVSPVASAPRSPEKDTIGGGNGQPPGPRLEITAKSRSYVGERIPVTIKAFFPKGQGATINTLPSVIGDGMVLEQLDSRPQQTTERLEGVEYSTLTWHSSLVGFKEGRYPLALQLDATLTIAERLRSLSPFGDHDPFSDELLSQFFGNIRKKTIKVRSLPLEMEIVPLPAAGQPPGFTGAIGNFSLQVAADPQTVDIGQPLTLTMTISGEGNFETVKAPSLPPDRRLKSYTPSAKFSPKGNSFHGQKTFEQAAIIVDPTITEVPPLSFSYFDPDRRKYFTATSPPIPLTVRPSAADTAGSRFPSEEEGAAVPKQNPAVPPESMKAAATDLDLAPQHQLTGPFSKSLAPLFTRTWFLAVASLCLVTAVLLLFLIYVRRRRTADIACRERKKMRLRHLQQSMADIEAAVRTEESRLFLSRCRSTIRQQLAMHWQLSSETITGADLAVRLDQASPLHEIFAIAEKSAYAGHHLNPGEMRRYADILLQELSHLR